MKIADFTFEDPSSAVASGEQCSTALDGGRNIAARFSEMALLYPLRRAVVDEEGSMTYRELDDLSQRIGQFLTERKLQRESRVGVMIERHRHFIAAIIGIIKAGCVYLPVDPTLPLERRRMLLSIADAAALVSSSRNSGDMQQLEWLCPSIQFSLTLDSDKVDSLVEKPGELMSTELWDHIASSATDDIEAGGWKSAFTGLPISPEAMAAFGANAHNKIAQHIKPGARVLEIGCASGFSMRHIAPLSSTYLATDLSRYNAERVEVVARSLGLKQVTGRHLAAHDIDILSPGSFDLIVMNSVIESFPGYGYLRMVLDKSMKLLAPGGIIFLGSLWNLDRHEAYLSDLSDFARQHPDEGYSTRSNLNGSFFVPFEFFSDWAAGRQEKPSVSASAVDAPGFDPAPYAFDLVITLDGLGGCAGSSSGRKAPLHFDRRSLFSLPPLASDFFNSESGPAHAAYLIFTSGTSGKPKGVLVEHGPVINLINAIEKEVYTPLSERINEQFLNISCCFSFAFDGSIHHIFTTLLNGHTLFIPEEYTRQDPEALHRFFQLHSINVADSTPSLFGLLLDYWQKSQTGSSVNSFILGGESFAASLVERFYALQGVTECEVWNAYGPTECCVSASQYRMSSRNWKNHLPPPIGAPLRGVDIKVCDEAGRLLPVGIPGEIMIGGAGLARGYINEPELTAARFILDENNKRWYRTGDIGRWIQPGLLQFIGREDRQVKVRGYRIELSEIESVLKASPLVRQAVVAVADPRNDGDMILVAYVVPAPGFDTARCRADLDLSLPAWMMPTLIVEMEALPLNSNGKLDEKRLPSLNTRGLFNQNSSPKHPFTRDSERRLALIWQSVLDVQVESCDDDFFLLGGHSVLGVRLVSLLESEFGVKLPLAELFTSTTIARMADRIEAKQAASSWNSVVAVNRSGDRTPIVCFHPVGGNVLCYKGLTDALGCEWPIYMAQASGLEAGQPLQPTVEAMVGGYLDDLRELLDLDRPLIMLGWSFGGLLAWEAAYQLRRLGVKIQRVIVLDGIASSDPIRRMLQMDEAEFIATMFDEMGLGSAEYLRTLTPQERLDMLVLHDRSSDYLPEGIDRDHLRRLLALFQNNGLAALRYQPKISSEELLLIRPRISSSQAPGIPGDDYNGWRPFAGGGVELCWIDGTHGQMLLPPFVGEIARHIFTNISGSL